MGGSDRWLMHQLRESSHLLLQGSDLGRELGKRPEQIEELTWQRRRLRWWRSGSRRRPLLWQSRKAAMMGGGEQEQVVACQPFEAGIAGMRLKGELSLGQPVMQGLGINGKLSATVGQRNDGHGATPFVLPVTRTTRSPANSRELSREGSPLIGREDGRETSRELSRENRPGVSWCFRSPDKQERASA
jgi:hypothetical protein